jgi:pimeloyl-ACP methyl ester carboxylesterase
MHSDFEHLTISTNGIRLHVVAAGPEHGPLVILLHGFPEFWYCWRHQIGPLAQSGYRVWAPDQRGYNTSDKPPGRSAYRLDALADDVLGLIDAADRRQATIIGHDWGGAVAWRLASRHPERLDRLVILNVPHPQVFKTMLYRSPRQTLRSWYIFAFQLPRLPEWFARRHDWRAMVDGLRQSSRPGTFSDADLERYREAWSKPGAFTAMVNWYRAALWGNRGLTEPERITTPTLMIWGVHDRFIGREAAAMSIELCANGQLVSIEEATHWVQHEEPQRVNQLIEEFLGAMAPPGPAGSPQGNANS